MSAHRVRHRIAAWSAMLALLMVAFAPSLSQVVAAASSGGWVEVCTVDGIDRLSADAESDAPPAAAHGLEHCPYCSSHAQSGGLLPVLAVTMRVAGPAESVPHAFLEAPRTPHAWRTAPSRAPPARV